MLFNLNGSSGRSILDDMLYCTFKSIKYHSKKCHLTTLSQENQTRNSEGRSSLKKVKLTYEETTPVQDNMYVE